MSSFKQKLKSILNDSSSLKDKSSIDQKFDQFLLKTYKKIKKDNTRHSIIPSNYFNNDEKTTRNLFINYSKVSKYQKGISPNTAKRMAQTFSLINNENSKNDYKDYSDSTFYETLNKVMKNSSKIDKKIQRDFDYITRDYNKSSSKIKYSTINRHKSIFNNNTINNINNHFNKNSSIYNIERIFENTIDKYPKYRGKEISGRTFRANLRKEKIDFSDYFNQFRKRKKFINFNF